MFDPPDFPYNTEDFNFSHESVTFTNSSAIITNEKLQNEHMNLHDNFEVGYGLERPISQKKIHFMNNGDPINESTLLDENTVNQFLLPAQVNNEEKKNDGEDFDLLALQSCSLCHEIFTSDADLLDHTISVHISDNTLEDARNNLSPKQYTYLENNNVQTSNVEPISDIGLNLDTEWLTCGICERVLSTALELEPTEQLCCSSETGKGKITRRILDTMYVCESCNGLFADSEALDRHKNSCFVIKEADSRYVTEEANLESLESPRCPDVCFSCGSCGHQYANAEDLKIHTISCHPLSLPSTGRRPYIRNTSSKMWNCGSCNQLFVTARELYRHKRGEDRPEGAPLTAYVCEECDKVLGSMCALHTHRKMHKVKKPGYPCRVCGRRFNQSGHLAIHMRMHTGERPYPCDLCSKAFKVKVERDDHRRTHTGERPFACTACPKTFTAAARLREHARIHTDQRPYKCEICGAAFRRPYARTVHTLIHTGEKPHECDICSTAFRRSGDMWKHKRTIHGTQLTGDEDRS